MSYLGPSAAKAVLAHFCIVDQLLRAEVAELRKVPGIGEKPAKRIRAILEVDLSAPHHRAVVHLLHFNFGGLVRQVVTKKEDPKTAERLLSSRV